MKHFRLLLSLMVFAAFLSCKKDIDPNLANFKITKEYLDVKTTSVSISGSYAYPGKINSINVAVGHRHDFTDAHNFLTDLNGNDFEVDITGLTPGTEYLYRYEVDFGASTEFLSEEHSFTTQSDLPTVKTVGWLELDSTTFRIKCEVLSGGGQEVTERGICWNNYGEPIINDDATLSHSSGGLGQYTILMEGLDLGKRYYVRSYAMSEAGIGYGEELAFETATIPGMPVMIALSCDPVDGGTVSGGGSVPSGSQCTVFATANPSYSFVNWTENGVQVSSDATYIFNVTVGRNLVANFTQQDYVITAQADPNEGGFVTGAGGYNYGDECTLNAMAKTGYTFLNWTKNGTVVSTNAQYDFTVTERATYVAHFQANNCIIGLVANPSDGGTVSGGGNYNYGQSCTVVATPAEGYIFTYWTEDGSMVSREASYTFAVTDNRNLVANFEEHLLSNYTISVSSNPSNGGTVNGGGTFQEGETCTVNAVAKTGFTFVNWTEDGNQISTEAEFSFTVECNRTLVANFVAQTPNSYTVTLLADPEEGGVVTGGGSYQPGQMCSGSATANEGYSFVNWTENGSVITANANLFFSVISNRTLVAHFTKNSYTITASANPSGGGTVTGGGSYEHSQSCTLRATASTGYTFINWTENGNEVSTDSHYTFNVTGNRNLVANFIQRHTVTVSANPSNGGTASGGGTFDHGQSCTVIATAANGYTFSNWTEGGNVVSTDANYTFIVNSNHSLVAHFSVQAPNTYNINVSPNPSNGGMVTGGGSYQQGQSCTVTATANTGYTFQKWTENGSQVSQNASYTFNVTSNRTLVAQFQVQSYTITASASPANGGNVSGGGTYNYGQSCTLVATPSTGYTFVKWTKNGTEVSTNARYTFTVTGSGTYVAHFQAQSFTITATADPTNGGSVTGGGTYTYGQNCTLTATSATGYTFVNWTKNGTQVSSNANYTFTVTGSGTYVAHFQVQSYTISATANPTNGGSVTGGGSYNYGQSCTLTATPASGYTFVNWTKNGTQVSSNANYTFTVTGSGAYVAHFEVQAPNTYTISVSSDPSNGGSVSGGGTYEQGQSCTVSATANAGYTFTNWTENGSVVSSNANYTFTVSSNRTLVAHFTAQTYTISVSGDPNNGGSVSGGGSYNYGQSCTLTATPASGYTFVNWTKNGTQVSTNATYTFTVTGSGTYVAHFSMQSYAINVSANPSNGGSVSGGGNYTYGQSCTVTATAATGYTFQGWTENGDQVSTSANYTFTVTGSRTLVAQFQANTYTVNVSATPSGSGTVSGGGTYTYGQNCTVMATASTGFAFTNWTEGGSQVSTNASYSFTVTSNRVLVAHFDMLASLPTVTTNSVTNLTSTTATTGGNVTDNGGAEVTERGVCWGYSANPDITGNHSSNGTGTGIFVENLANLTPATDYHVRAYATNSAGTNYGDDIAFTTPANLPTVTTGEVTNITRTTAICSGNVSDNGGAPVTERGICWGTSHNPTVSGDHTTSGTGNGSFSLQMTGLNANKTYYVRAYAVNSAGVKYGEEVAFSTPAINLIGAWTYTESSSNTRAIYVFNEDGTITMSGTNTTPYSTSGGHVSFSTEGASGNTNWGDSWNGEVDDQENPMEITGNHNHWVTNMIGGSEYNHAFVMTRNTD